MTPPSPLPYIPSWKNVRVFVLGLLWCCMGGLGPAVYEIWDAQHYEDVDWNHIRISIGLGVAPMAIGYWRKYRALVTPPEEQ